MYDFEIANRKQFFYPPYSRVIKITLKHKVKDVVDEAANILVRYLQADLKDFVVGPAAPIVNRIRSQYLMEVLIKLPLDMKMIVQYKRIILNHFNVLNSEKRFKSVVIVSDVDTY